MYVRDIMTIVRAEETMLEILKEYKLEKPKDIVRDIMEFILQSDLCDRTIRGAYSAVKQQQEEKKKG